MGVEISACLDDNAIAALLEGAIEPAERARSTAHIDACDACRALVADASRAGSAPVARVLRAGMTLGRYVILETVGAGAMGVVYGAYDPELGRKVAIKLLRPDPLEDRSSGDARERLLREAQALAKLSHPHVITIHDVGTLDGEVFLTMEFVEGGTFADWLRAEPRTWRAVVHLLRQAGEGLAATHEAGLLHRDFKPENVLVGAGDRAWVTDFGLVRGASETGAIVDGSTVSPGTGVAGPATRLTMTGRLLGTPAYMSPERFAGAAIDAQSDQFSFCATLYEGLYGDRPFEGKDVASLAASIARGVVRAAPGDRRVPAWLRRIVLRGLEASPSRRFPSMRALLAALDAGPLLSPKRLGIASAAFAAVAAFAAFASARRPPPMCGGAELAWNGAWDDARAAAIRTAFERSLRPSQEHAYEEVTRILDDDRSRWQAMHKDTCEATRVRGEQSEVVLDARMRCLDEHRKEVAALARLLGEADGDLVNRSVAAALSLPPLDRCKNVQSLTGLVKLPASPEARAEIERLDDRLAEENALEYAGKYAEGLRVSVTALEDARATRFAPLIARLLLVEGRLAKGALDHARAERVLHEAGAVAVEAHEDLIAADAWITLARVAGVERGKPEEARLWARYAEAAIVRAGGDDEREAARLRGLADLASRIEGNRDEALGLLERARRLYDRSHGPHYEFEITRCDEVMAGIVFDMARPAEALDLYRRTAEVRERLFGGDHPSVATACVNQGEALTLLGRPDEAIPLIERAIAIAAPTSARGGDAYYRHRLAAALRAKGDYAAALVEDRRALAASTLAGETGGRWESWPLTGLGLDLLALGHAGEAVSPLERAVTLRAIGTTNAFEFSESRFALARALWETGTKVRARTLAREARDVLAPDANRYGAWYATARDGIERWLGEHP